MTTTRVTHATPAATYSHVPNRRWECDSSLGQTGQGCKDIASQLVSEHPGRDIRVINFSFQFKVSIDFRY